MTPALYHDLTDKTTLLVGSCLFAVMVYQCLEYVFTSDDNNYVSAIIVVVFVVGFQLVLKHTWKNYMLNKLHHNTLKSKNDYKNILYIITKLLQSLTSANSATFVE